MNRDFRLLVFDWDGTLMDSEARILSCVKAAARDLGLETPADTAIRPGSTKSVSTAQPKVVSTAPFQVRTAAVVNFGPNRGSNACARARARAW